MTKLENEEIISVLDEVNRKSKNPVELVFLKQILSLVAMNPLDTDRLRCQKQIMKFINQKRGD